MDQRLNWSLVLLVFILASHITDVLARHHHIKLRHARHRRQHIGDGYLPTSFVSDTDEEETGTWGPWSSASSCSRSCGGGVADQTRSCREIDNATGNALCTGAKKRFFTCNIQPCPEPTQDFRAEQCAEYNTVPIEGVYYDWIPYTGGPNKCELNCMPRGEIFFYRHKASVTDGTPCTTEQNDICVQGKCRPVGCDMILGSPAKEDRCRECGGDGSACDTIQGLLDVNDLQVGYNDILLIPAGATNIAINEVRPSNNYLAIRNITGHYYLNGNWRIDFPRSLRFAGSTFHYERRPKELSAADIINALGPTSEALYIVLLSQGVNVGVNYEYSIPKRLSKQSSPDSYTWVMEGFSDCSASCGGGFQSRLVRCVRRGDNEVSDRNLCDQQLEPPDTQPCGMEPCPPEWVVKDWGPCSKQCGSGGEQTRQIICEQIISGGVPSIVDDLRCLDIVGPKDIEVQECNKDIQCPQWHTGPWKPCDRLCGKGKETRKVTCYKKVQGKIFVLSDSVCQEERPESEKECELAPCSGLDWVVSNWSGCDDNCGLTQETRTTSCVTLDGEVWPEEQCNPDTKPILVRDCSAQDKCAYQWYATQWSECSVNCGTGIQTRKVFCGASPSGSETITKVEDEKCDPSKKYNNTKSCKADIETCKGEWFAGPWSECSKPCGGGEMTRKVICMKDNKVVSLKGNCDASDIMYPREYCNKKPCEEDGVIPVEPGKPITSTEEEAIECEDYQDDEFVSVHQDLDIVDSENDDGTQKDAPSLISPFDINSFGHDFDEFMMADGPVNVESFDGGSGEVDQDFTTDMSSSDTSEGSGSGSTSDSSFDTSSFSSTFDTDSTVSPEISETEEPIFTNPTSAVPSEESEESDEEDIYHDNDVPDDEENSNRTPPQIKVEGRITRPTTEKPQVKTDSNESSTTESGITLSSQNVSESQSSEETSETSESFTMSSIEDTGSTIVPDSSSTDTSLSTNSNTQSSDADTIPSLSSDTSLESSTDTTPSSNSASTVSSSLEATFLSSLGTAQFNEDTSVSSSSDTTISSSLEPSGSSGTDETESSSSNGTELSSSETTKSTSSDTITSSSSESTGSSSTDTTLLASSESSESSGSDTTTLSSSKITEVSSSDTTESASIGETKSSSSQTTEPSSSETAGSSSSPISSLSSSETTKSSSSDSTTLSSLETPGSSSSGTTESSSIGETELSSSQTTESSSSETAGSSSSPISSLSSSETTKSSSSDSTTLSSLETPGSSSSGTTESSSIGETELSNSQTTESSSSETAGSSSSPISSLSSSETTKSSSSDSTTLSSLETPGSSSSGTTESSSIGETELSSSQTTESSSSETAGSSSSPISSLSSSETTKSSSSDSTTLSSLETPGSSSSGTTESSSIGETELSNSQTTESSSSETAGSSSSPISSLSSSETTKSSSSDSTTLSSLETPGSSSSGTTESSSIGETKLSSSQTTEPSSSETAGSSSSPISSLSSSETTKSSSSDSTTLSSLQTPGSSSSDTTESSSSNTVTSSSSETVGSSSTGVIESSSSEVPGSSSFEITTGSSSSDTTVSSSSDTMTLSSSESTDSSSSDTTLLSSSESSVSSGLDTTILSSSETTRSSISETTESSSSDTTTLSSSESTGSSSSDTTLLSSSESSALSELDTTTLSSSETPGSSSSDTTGPSSSETTESSSSDTITLSSSDTTVISSSESSVSSSSDTTILSSSETPGSSSSEITTESSSLDTSISSSSETTESSSSATTVLSSSDETTSGSSVSSATTESASSTNITESESTGTFEESTGTEETSESEITTEGETTESGITSETTESGITDTDEDLDTTGQSHITDIWTTISPITKAITSEQVTQKCIPKKRKTCKSSPFGCCYNSTKAATGPFEQGCPIPKTCKETTYGCCPDEVSPAAGFNNLGCPDSHCDETLFGCCPDNVTPAEGNDYEGCPIPCNKSEFGCCPDEKTPAAGKDNLGCCNVTAYGCCPDGFKPASGPDAEGCDEKETSTVTTPGDEIEVTTTSEVETTTTSEAEDTTTSQVTVTTVSEVEKDCTNSEFGCCPDQKSPAAGTNFEGCGVTTIELPIEPHMACENSTFSCCDDGTTPAHGPNKEGCCLATPYGCCPDNIQHAQGPDLYGCGCQYYRYGCCPNNTTPARGSNNEGCACEHTPHGCCPNRITAASGPDFEGCACHTYQFGCCPDGVSVAKGPQAQGCGCENTEFKCCSDGITPAKGENYAGCTCDASKYGCCPDGVEEAQGDNFEGCLTVLSNPGAACALEKDRGSCSDFTVQWFFDTEYGGCSKFWYGGCEGNENRFKSLDECKDVCVKPKGRDACFLPKISGPCEEYHPTWYFDTERKQCGQFIYKGCLGNANKFKTRDECEELCVIPDDIDACEQPKEVGPCAGNFTRWYFNKESDSCEEFTYGGCKANKNNFPTQISCQQKCLTPGRSRVRDVCVLDKEPGPCPGSSLRWYYDVKRKSCRQFVFGGCKGNGNKFRTYAACEQRCPVRDSCSLPREEGSCTEKHARWSFDPSEKRCMPFYYTGCGGNKNNYETRDACDSDCPPKIEQDTCLLPALLGECYNYTQRWYYDSYESRCRQFYYGGCGGNGNNFATEHDCTHRCQPSAITPPPKVPQFQTEFCFLPDDHGSCTEESVKWFYDSRDGVCKPFRYGGCAGNGNNFNTAEECESRCGNVQDLCQMPPVVGPCRAAFTRYYYDRRTDTCHEFIFGGCQGNGNNFETKNTCEQRCRKSTDVTTTTMETTTIPVTEITPKSTTCSLPLDAGPCTASITAYYYDINAAACQAFIYGGCEGNANKFQTEEQCERLCGSFQGQDVCNIQADPGPCRGAYAKFYYDPTMRSCREFSYSGCDGNANRFTSVEECESVCIHREEPPVLGNITATSNEAICSEPVNTGSCSVGSYKRFYYSDEYQNCIAFIYTGCGGNRNRFKNYESCMKTCSPDNAVGVGPEPEREDPCSAARAECETIRCPYGTEDYVDEKNCQHCRCVDPCRTEICQEGTKCAVTLVSVGGSVAYRSVCRSVSKPGNCPKVSNTTSCQEECSSDADCDSDFKCCANGCGSSCLQPAPEEPLTTPPPPYVVTVPYPDAIAATIEEPIEPNVSAEEGSYVVLKCPCHGNPRPSIIWRKDVTLIDNSVSRHSISVDGSLQIVDLYRSDAGTYTCTADNRLAAPVRIQYVLTITAPQKHTSSILGPQNYRVTVTLNSPTILRCNVVGWPRPLVNWWHEDNMLPLSTTVYEQQRDHSLKIHRVSLVNLGVYTCQAYNGIEQPASWSVILQAPGPVYNLSPENQKYARYLVEPEKSPVNFSTVRPPLESTPRTTKAPQIQTYEPFYPSLHINIPAIASTTEPSPEIVPPRYSVPVKVNVSADQGPFPEGSEFSIVCNVDGFPLPRVEWFKDDNPIRIDNRITISSANRLIITDAEKSDSGRYRCQAANQLTNDADTIDITVAGIYIHPNCQDNSFFARCNLIVKGNFCKHQYYARFCCRSCTEAGQLPARGPHINETRRKRRSVLSLS